MDKECNEKQVCVFVCVCVFVILVCGMCVYLFRESFLVYTVAHSF